MYCDDIEVSPSPRLSITDGQSNEGVSLSRAAELARKRSVPVCTASCKYNPAKSIS